jgi:phosphonatase-like hydrolase
MAIRLVVFDVAGTTVQSGDAVQRTMHDAIAAAGLVLRDGAMTGVTGMAKPQAIRTLLEGHGRDELVGRADAIHADFVKRMQRFYRTDPSVVAMPGAEETFAVLHAAGIRVALDTGFSRAILDIVLERLGWLGAAAPIDASIASDEVARGRPHPDMINALVLQLGGFAPEEVAKVGDTPIDLYEGTMARCGLVVGVLSGAHDRESLSQHPADAIIGGVAELPGLLASRES